MMEKLEELSQDVFYDYQLRIGEQFDHQLLYKLYTSLNSIVKIFILYLPYYSSLYVISKYESTCTCVVRCIKK